MGFWSHRVDEEHRLAYAVEDSVVVNITDRFAHAFDNLNIHRFRFHDLRHPYVKDTTKYINIKKLWINQSFRN